MIDSNTEKSLIGYEGDFTTFLKVFLSGNAENGSWFQHVCDSVENNHWFRRPGISSNPFTSLKSNSFSMILEPLVLASRVLDDCKKLSGNSFRNNQVEGILKRLFRS